jgi:hypothetical protein
MQSLCTSLLKDESLIIERKDSFKRYEDFWPDQCIALAKLFSTLRNTSEEIFEVLKADRNTLTDTVCGIKVRAHDIERLFYRFEKICRKNTKEKRDVHEEIYNKLIEFIKELGELKQELDQSAITNQSTIENFDYMI